MIPFSDKLYGDCDYIFQEDFAPAHPAKSTKTWFSNHGINVHNLPANSSGMSLLEKDERHETKLCRRAEEGF